MIKLLPIALLITLALGFVTFKVFTNNQVKVTSTTPVQSESLTSQIPLEEVSPTAEPAPSETDTITSLQEKIKSLEDIINDLKQRIVVLESKQTTSVSSTSQSTQSTSSTSKAPAYIPLAASGSSSVGDWANISGTTVTINPADYPGYTSMQFEGNIQIFQQGKAFARVGATDGTSVLSSEISTTSTSYTYVISSNFTLPSKKDYQLQLKSLVTGYAAQIQNARIKVNF